MQFSSTTFLQFTFRLLAMSSMRIYLAYKDTFYSSYVRSNIGCLASTEGPNWLRF